MTILLITQYIMNNFLIDILNIILYNSFIILYYGYYFIIIVTIIWINLFYI